MRAGNCRASDPLATQSRPKRSQNDSPYVRGVPYSRPEILLQIDLIRIEPT